MAFRPVATLDTLWEGELAGVVVDGRRVLLTRFDDQVYAWQDRCTHQDVPLHDGRLEGRVVHCAAHDWTFDLTTGRGENPAGTQLERYAVRVEGGVVSVDVDAVLQEERRVSA